MKATPSFGSVRKCHPFNRKNVAFVTNAVRLFPSKHSSTKRSSYQSKPVVMSAIDSRIPERTDPRTLGIDSNLSVSVIAGQTS